MQETWKDIIGYEGIYQISNLGRVKSLSRKVPGKLGSIRIVKEKMMCTNIDCDGYYRYNLIKDGRVKHFKRSSLMARHFIPNPNNLPEVRHLNDIKTDDRLENFAWGTRQDNARDAAINKKFPSGENHHNFNKQGFWFGKRGEMSNMFGKRGEDANNKKLILDQYTGIFYDTIKEAAIAKSIKGGTLRAMLCGQNKNKSGLIYA